MATYRIQHAFQAASGASRDQYVNGLYYTSAVPPTATAVPSGLVGDQIATAVRGFYEAFSSYLSSTLNFPFRTIKIYDVAAPPNSSAVYEVTDSAEPFPLLDAGVNLPEEVAVCMSYTALAPPGTIRARRRGRIYLGPLNTTALAFGTESSAQQHVNAGLITAINGAADAFAGELTAVSATWCMYSKTDSAAHPIVQVSVDNAFDTQRRRGVDASSSTSVTI